MSKQRKGQSDEEFIQQKLEYNNGPPISSTDWLVDAFDSDTLDTNLKTDQTIMFHACERVYFMRDYDRCLGMIDKIEKVVDNLRDSDLGKYTKLKKQIIELDLLKEKCLIKRTTV